MSKHAIFLLGSILALGSAHLATLRDGQDWGDDFGLYVAHARNIAEGRPYDDTGYIYNPQNAIVSPRSYPPVFPLMLAPVYRLRGLDLTAMKEFGVLLFMATLGVLAVIFRKHLPFPYTLACLVMFAVNPYVWQYKDRLLSEIPFMFLAYLALLLTEKATEADGSRVRALVWGLAAGLTAYLAFGTRTVGVLLIPSVLGVELLRRRRLGLASLAILAAFAAGVGVQKYLLPSNGSASYLDQLVFDPLRFARIGLSLVKGMGMFLENGYSRMGCAVLYGCLLLLAGTGYAARFRKGPTVYELFSAFNFLLLTAWPPAESNPRFLLPLLPLFFLYIGEGLSLLHQRFPRPANALAVLAALSVLVSNVGLYTRLDFGPVRDGVSTPESLALFNWIRTRTDAEDAFLFQKPKAIALYTRRAAMAHHRPADDEQMWQLLKSKGITHIIVCQSSPTQVFQSSRKILEPFIERNAERFEQVYANSGFRVYHIHEARMVSR
jgi:4-amino-4-deoxy-L-arabinose transferase-like glycosyltransferase